MLVNGINYTERKRELTAQGIDPFGSDDTVFGVKYVFCNQHVNAHPTGWCTVHNIEKFPLTSTTAEAARDEYRAMGLLGLWDPRPCNHCGTPVTLSPVSGQGYLDENKNLACEPDNPRSRRHSGRRD